MFTRYNKIKGLILLLSIFFVSPCWANPSTSVTGLIYPSPQTTITSSDYTTNLNTIANAFNSHTHSDISQVGTITSGTWAGSVIGTAYIAQGAGAITGEVRMWAGTTGNVPTGWLACDGSAVSRTTYAALFAIISTNYGTGDGSTTFNLPNWNAGKFVKGSATAGTSAGATTNTAAGTTDSHTLTTAEMPSHSHVEHINGTDGTVAGSYVSGTNSSAADTATAVSTSSAGGDGGHTHTFTSSSFSIEYSNQTAIMIIRT